jgi:S1-C subfamily serine protease
MTPTLRLIFCGWLLVGALGTAAAAPQKSAAEPSPAIAHEAESAVVKVFSTIRRPDVARPWSKAAPIEATGSGVVIEGKRILTNAHVVA